MTSRDKRQRELARQRAERQEQRRADAERRRRRRAQIVVGVIVAAMVLTTIVGLVSALTGDDADSSAAPEPTATEPADSAAPQCDYIDNAPDPATVTDVGRPTAEPGDLGTLTATMTLNGEPVVMSLDGTGAACTANSWEFLAAADYFDGTTCHRLTTSDTLGVLQCGDPSGTGTGGPGYRFAEENTDGATYPAGTVAMANTGQPASTGSQFFVVHSDSVLPPDYTVVGQVTEGLDVVRAIAEAGTVSGSADGAPAAGAEVSDLVVERSAT
jgi:peptidyl-prolyl cis-trans isomerase B (cyclophilin B)